METNYSVLNRVVGTNASVGTSLGLYKDASGNQTTYRPEFAGQTVQMGRQYVTYNELGYPVKSISVKHAQKLGNDYTMEHFGIDQTKIANAGDVYQAIYNTAMEKASIVSGSELDEGYGKRNIQYDGALGLEDYDTLIREAVASGNNVLAGFYEDSRNALIADKGLSVSLQTNTFNGGWNYVDNGGGVGDIHAGAVADPDQADQAAGGGWIVGQGKGNAEKEYIYSNYDTPSVEEVLHYAAVHGYPVNNEHELEEATLRMMAEGYLSEETLHRAELLKMVVPEALRKLGIESSSTGTDALDEVIRTIRAQTAKDASEN